MLGRVLTVPSWHLLECAVVLCADLSHSRFDRAALDCALYPWGLPWSPWVNTWEAVRRDKSAAGLLEHLGSIHRAPVLFWLPRGLVKGLVFKSAVIHRNRCVYGQRVFSKVTFCH